MYLFHLVLIWMTNILVATIILQKTDFFSSHACIELFLQYQLEDTNHSNNIQLLFIGLQAFLLLSVERICFLISVTSLNLLICHWFLVTWMLDFVLIWRQEVTSWSPLWFGHCYSGRFNNIIDTCAFTKCCYFVHCQTTQTFHEMFGKIKILQCLPVTTERQELTIVNMVFL